MAVLSWGSSGVEVERLQAALKAAGCFNGIVDGFFGAMTYSAVLCFQRAHNLEPDGIAGPATIAALETGAGADDAVTGSARAISLHIGINRVDPAAYGGWDGTLSGCERDAETMAAIAGTEGFSVRRLVAPQADSKTILAEIRRAAQAVTAGGTFLLTYAGHGGQVPDTSGEEQDKLDETWVAFDRQILDDELMQAYAEFDAGVTIVVVSDSCHSGTVNRLLPPGIRGRKNRGEAEWELQQPYAELKASFYRNLAAARPGPADPAFAEYPRPSDELLAREGHLVLATSVGAEVPVHSPAGVSRTPIFAPAPGTASRVAVSGEGRAYATRCIPPGENIAANQIQKRALANAKKQAGEHEDVRADGLLLAGCQDNQLSQEVGGAGVFTTAVNRVWAANNFGASYEQFMSQVVSQMGPTQTPKLSRFGAQSVGISAKTPFDIS